MREVWRDGGHGGVDAGGKLRSARGAGQLPDSQAAPRRGPSTALG
jgi:hypothetical protein